MKFLIRNAGLDDIPFLVETIIEAEKSGTNILSYENVFGLTELETKKYLAQMLNEEIDDCELSVSCFLMAENNGEVLGAVGAWIEGIQGIPSSVLKGNLLSYTLPKSCFEKALSISKLLNELHIENVNHSIMIGLVYVSEKARGQGLVKRLITDKIEHLKSTLAGIENAYVQVFSNNVAAIKAYEKCGFKIIETKISKNKEIEKYLPSSSKCLMHLKLN
jgi:ribosomal protein S18 acetylase RimI-like enzyme